jgi:molybdenum cofactor cytidylyltransferase
LNALLAHKTVLQRTLDAVRASQLAWHLEAADYAGMGDTIAAAVRTSIQASGWLIQPADLPLVKSDTLRRVAGGTCLQVTMGSSSRFSASVGPALCSLQSDLGASPVLRMHKTRELIVDQCRKSVARFCGGGADLSKSLAHPPTTAHSV